MEQKLREPVTCWFIGAAKAGKTALLRQFMGADFEATYRPTLSTDYYAVHHTDPAGKNYHFSLFEVGGTECYVYQVPTVLHQAIQHRDIPTIVIVLDGSVDEIEREAQLKKYLDVVADYVNRVPLYFFINKLDLIDVANRTAHEQTIIQAIWQQWYERKLSSPIRFSSPSIQFCSAKTGEGVTQALNALLGYEEKPTVTDENSSESETGRSSDTETAAVFDAINDWVTRNKLWMGGNLLMLTLTLAVLAFALLFSVSSVLTVGILPAWAFTVLLGSTVLLVWCIGWGLYQQQGSNRENTLMPDNPNKMQPDESTIEEILKEEDKEVFHFFQDFKPNFDKDDDLGYTVAHTVENQHGNKRSRTGSD